MPVFSNLEDRVRQAPFDAEVYLRRLPAAQELANAIHLVHVSGKGVSFLKLIENSPQEIPTSAHPEYYSDDTRRAEELLGLPRSAYFYAGRAHPKFGNVALAFSAECEQHHSGSATPFDTGGLVHRERYIKVRLTPNDGDAERVQYGQESCLELKHWREVFGRVLAAYFDEFLDYWNGRPARIDPEGLYELNNEWRAWAFEVRFAEGQPLQERAAWCADEAVMNQLRWLQDAQEAAPPGDAPSPLDRFLQGPASLVPAGSPHFCDETERWIKGQLGL